MLSRLATLFCLTALTLSAEESFIRDTPQHRLEYPAVAEASGIAVSPTRPNRLWIINDSGGTPELHLTGSDGSDHGKVTVRGVKNIDWEDLSSFVLDGKPYLLIADTGDNASKREECQLHVVAEPEGDAKEVAVAWTIRFTYDDGPRDCEAVAVDEKSRKILLLSKRTRPPMLYEIPLRPSGEAPHLAKKVGQIDDPLATGLRLPLPYGSQPTGLSLSADGQFAAVVTYARVFLFTRPEGGSWADAFATKPQELAHHRLDQAESIAFSRDGAALFVVSEGLRSPLVHYRRGKE